MAISSAGYTGSVDQTTWAKMASLAGTDAVVAGSTDLAVSGVAGTRRISVAAGTAWGWGVLDTVTGTDNYVDLPANATGATRYDAIVVRRTWGTPATTLTYVTGGSTDTVPSLTVNPGTQADQVLATVAVPNGATSLVGATVTDRRQWPGQLTVGPQAPYSPSLGQVWKDLAGNESRWNGSAWVLTNAPTYTAATLASGIVSRGTLPVAYGIAGGRCWLSGIVGRTGSVAFAAGWTTLMTLPTGFRPVSEIRQPVGYGASSLGGEKPMLEVSTAGVVRVFVEMTTQNAVYLDNISFRVI